ncbi:MAG: transposase, partial [Vampirovibrionales bacterium]|nr:transposase [Vampirovibrionales bacterium]
NDLGRPRTRDRECFETIRYVLITGIQWCNIPDLPGFVPKSTAHRRFQHWVNDGFFDRLLKWLSPDEVEALSLLHLDATVLVAKKGRPNLESGKVQDKQNDRSRKSRRSAA